MLLVFDIEQLSGARLVPYYLMSSYLYYHCNQSLMSDEAYDRLCQRLDDEWMFIEHPHLHLIDRASLSATTGFTLRLSDYPMIVCQAAHQLLDSFNPARHGELMSKINIVQIQAALGLPITADFIVNKLNIKPVETVKRAVYWSVGEYVTICDRLTEFVKANRDGDPTKFSGDRAKKAEEPAATGEGFSFGDDAGFEFGDEPAADAGFEFGEEEAATEDFF